MAHGSAGHVGHFRLEKVLGEGAMGSVHLAVHTVYGTRVALKKLRAEAEEARLAFLEEARAVCRLDHPHIARVYDYGVHRGTPWFAMELAQSTLEAEAVMAQSWRALGAINRQLLDALAHAHARGVVHRDLKPSNVLMATPRDHRPGVKLVDFGIAATSRSSIVRAGTPSYMAPEQWSGDLASVGPWTDLYALGALFWALCCGRPPIHDDDLATIWSRQEQDDLDPFNPRLDVPQHLEEWLRTCLRARPGERFSCVADALSALDDVESVRSGTRAPPAPPPAATGAATLRHSDIATLSLEEDYVTVTDSSSPTRQRPPPAPIPESFQPPPPHLPPAPVAGTSLRVLAWTKAPIAGREPEQATLWRHLVETERSRCPQTVVLTGPPGVGCTTLGRWLVQETRATSGARGVVASDLQELLDGLLQPYGPPRDPESRQRALRREGLASTATAKACEALAEDDGGVRAAGMVLDLLYVLTQDRTLVVFLDAPRDPGLRALAARWHELDGPALLVVTDPEIDGDRIHLPPVAPNAVARALSNYLPLHPTLVRQIIERSAGMPKVVSRLLKDIALDLVLGAHGFELPGGLPAAPSLPDLGDLAPEDRRAVEALAHLDASCPVSLWAQVAGRRRTEVLKVTSRLVLLGLATTERGCVRLDPTARAICRQEAMEAGRDRSHHLAIARVLDDYATLPVRRGQAWVHADQVATGVGVWLDHWRPILRSQGFEATEALFREAELLVAELPPDERLHGRLEALVPILTSRNHGSRPPAEALERFHGAMARGWWDSAADHLRWTALCAHGHAEAVFDEHLESVRGRCSPGSWAMLNVTRAMLLLHVARPAQQQLQAAEQAMAEAERDPTCGHSITVSAELLPRLRHRLQATLASLAGDHEGAVRAMRIVVRVAQATSNPTLMPDQVDLGLAELAAGRPAEAEAVFAAGERWARWVGSYPAIAAFTSQRAGLAVLAGDWDRAATLARRAVLGFSSPYPVAMMRLISCMPAVVDGHLGPLRAQMPQLLPDLCVITRPDPELRACIDRIRQEFARAGEDLPDEWQPLLDLA